MYQGSRARDPGSPSQAEIGQAGYAQSPTPPIPPSTPSSDGRQRQAQASQGLGGKGQGLPGNGMGMCGGCPNGQGVGGNGMPNVMQGNVSQDFMYGPQSFACGGQCFQPGAQTGVGNLVGNVQNLVGNVPNLVGNAGNLFGNVGNLASRPGNQPSFDVGNQNLGFGAQIGGVTPQTQAVNQMLHLSQGLNNQQLLTLMQGLQEQVRNQGRVLPENFGQLPEQREMVFPPGIPGLNFGNDLETGVEGFSKVNDVFSKSEKWLGTPPVPSVTNWVSRESEIIGWAQYVSDLSAWAAQASVEFSLEIQQASRWPSPIGWETLSATKKARSMRLHAILKAAFQEHARTMNLITAYSEGVSLVAMGSSLSPSQMSNGFELLRQLTCEYSLRTRSEALSLRTAFATKVFQLKSNETSPTSVVSDVIRKVDLEAARYGRLLGTLPSGIDAVGLQLSDADLLMILMRSLPDSAKMYTVHHSQGDTYQSYRDAARKWELQQRMFVEQFSGSNTKERRVNEVGFATSPSWEMQEASASSWSGAEWYPMDEEFGVSAVSAVRKCGKCGSRKHETGSCTTDLSKIKCFSCGSHGHIGANCKNREKGRHDSGKGSGVVQSSWDKGKGKGKRSGKGYGKKGKLNELSEFTDDEWWWYENDWSTYGQDWGIDHVGQWYEQTDEWYGENWDSWEQQGLTGESTLSVVKNEGKEESNKPEKPVGSLILSPLFGEISEEEVDFCRFHVDLVGSDACPQPFLEGSGGDLGVVPSPEVPFVGSDVCPQPFLEGSGIGEFLVPEFLTQNGEIPAPGQRVFENEKGLRNERNTTRLGLMGAEEQEVNHDEFFDGLIAERPMKCRRLCFGFPTFLNFEDTVSHDVKLRSLGKVVSPLLSELSPGDDIGWWLLDSGAAVTVLAKHCLIPYGGELVRTSDESKFSAANGSSVSMHGRAEISVFMCLRRYHDETKFWKKGRLTTLVGDTRHNILSTTSLAQSGWQFKHGRDGVSLTHEDSGDMACELAVFAGCPWIRLHPHSGLDHAHEEFDLSREDRSSGVFCPLSKAARAELEQHRNQGHVPHNPHCVECARGRGTHQHRRRDGDTIETELQADFAFLSQTGEISDVEKQGAVKVLVLTECQSNAVGYVVVGDDVAHVRSLILKWIQHFGLESEQTSIILHTDAEQAVRNLVTNCSPKYVFHVRKSRNQQHQSLGYAERAVRRLRESLSVLRADMNAGGWDIRFDYDSLQESLTYVGLTHNHFGKSRESDFSPLELIAGRRLSKPVTALFGSTVLAELPSSLKKDCPNETRQIECSYLHPGIDHGPIVQGKMRIDGQRYLARFAARNVRQITPISWKADLCDSFLQPFDLGDSEHLAIDGSSNPDRPPDSDRFQGDLPMPLEPPKSVRNPRLKIGFEDLEKSYGHSKRTEMSSPEGQENKRAKVSFEPKLNLKGDYTKTPGCPSCDTGMDAPGIRHSAKCKRINQPVVVSETPQASPERGVEDMEIENESECDYVPTTPSQSPPGVDVEEIPQEEEFLERTKRKHSDGEVEDIERDLKRERLDELLNDSSLGLFWEETADPVFTISQVVHLPTLPATPPGMLIENLTSIRYDASMEHGHQEVTLGQGKVLVWRPTEAIDDSTLAQVDTEQCFVGMCEEVHNMESCGAGLLLNASQVQDLKQAHPNARIIQARWVVARKSDVKVRARIVAKDIKKHQTARQLGYSSPTPSVESLHILLAHAAVSDFYLRSLDISHAFMHSPVPEGENIVLKLPQSVSMLDGTQAFLHLRKALNGLRDASLHWLNLLATTIRRTGLWSDATEPCVYQGSVTKRGTVVGIIGLVVYVDDLLLTASSRQAEDVVIKALSGAVPTKVTGAILPSDQGGGSLTFIGRHIHRRPGEKALFLSVDPEYLAPAWEEYQVKRGSDAVPDIAAHLEKEDEQSKKKLSPEGYHRFRKALGKLLWLSQTRCDLKLYLSLIGSLQSDPTCGADNAIKALLRFLYNDRHLLLRLPSASEDLTKDSEGLVNRLHVWSDASHAPYRFNKRKGISGEVIAYKNAIVRTVAKQQQATSLSSCEAELYAIQLAAQDSVGLARFLQRFLFGIGEIEEFAPVDLWLESDSMSAIQLLHGLDVPRRSRHVEIRILWLKSKIDEGTLKLSHRYGEGNCADLFTKCLSTKDFLKHRAVLGFEGPERPVASLMMLSEEMLADSLVKDGKFEIAIFEICCAEHSSLRAACERLGIPYLGVSANMQTKRVHDMFLGRVHQCNESKCWKHVHVSTPCTFGSPLRHFHCDENEVESEETWRGVMSHVTKYLKHSNSCSSELPTHNAIWKKEETKRVLTENKLKHDCEVFLCQTGMWGTDGKAIGKSLKFCSDSFAFCQHLSKKFGTCNCLEHSGLSSVSFKKTGFYTSKLAESLVRAAILARRSS